MALWLQAQISFKEIKMGESELFHVAGVPQRRLPVGGDARVLLQQLLHPGQACPLKPRQDQTQQKVAFSSTLSMCNFCFRYDITTELTGGPTLYGRNAQKVNIANFIFIILYLVSWKVVSSTGASGSTFDVTFFTSPLGKGRSQKKHCQRHNGPRNWLGLN